MRTGYTQLISESNGRIRKIKDNAIEQIKEQQNRVLALVEQDFVQLGWKRWTSEILHMDEQLRRLAESAEDTELELIGFDNKTHDAIVKDKVNYLVSGTGCSCPDFTSRGLPCKHMYFLAGLLARPVKEEEPKNSRKKKR